MVYKIPYKIDNVMITPALGKTSLDGMIGARADRFFYERVSGSFAIKEILGEAESFFETKLDDELSHGLWRCEFWGKQIISSCEVCRYKKDDELKKKIKKSAYKMISFQREDGYLSTYRDSENMFQANTQITRMELGWPSPFNWNVWGRKYTMWGLIECALLLDDDNILCAAEKMADHLIGQIKKHNVRLKDTGVMDGMPACSIIKPMLILYRLTAKEEYLDFCLDVIEQWQRDDGEKPNLIANALSDKAPAHWFEPEYEWFAKAYEMLSCFEGILELYRIVGDEKLLESSEAFYNQLVKYEMSILGSVGHCAIFGDGAKYADAGTEICDVIHWMRLCHELFLVTGKVQYMESFEKAFVNAFLAGVYEDGRSGAFMVRGRGQHRYATPDCSSKYQNCCLSNIPRGFTNAAVSCCTLGEKGYYINLYNPSCTYFGDTLIHVDEGYFDKGNVTITVRNGEKGKKLFLRIPSWSEKTAVFIGGKATEFSENGIYSEISFDGDIRLRIVFDMSCKTEMLPCTMQELDPVNRHIIRWIDPDNGICNRGLLLKTPVCAVTRGALLLARSKKIGSHEKDMFETESVFGKDVKITAKSIRHDLSLCLCSVKLTVDGREWDEFLMCDYASCSNFAHLDSKYFTIYI